MNCTSKSFLIDEELPTNVDEKNVIITSIHSLKG